MNAMEDFGRHMATLQDPRIAQRGAAEQARGRFLASPLGRRRPSPYLALAAAAAILGSVVFVGLGLRPRGLRASVGGEAFSAVEGRRVTSPEGRTLPVRFSDGSSLDLAAGSKLVITALAPTGAEAVLEEGQAAVSVVHGPDTHWALKAGPYHVAVVGTRFDLAWQPSDAHLVVRLREGRVVVSGGNLVSPVSVEAGQALSATPTTWNLTAANDPLAIEGPRASTREPASVATADPGPIEGAVRPSAPLDPGTEGASGKARAPLPQHLGWQQLARSGKYDEAMEAVERDGFGAACRAASAEDLMTLSETARFAKRGGRSRRALLALRDRFPADVQAPMAAFLLGRMAGSDGEAIRWFRVYLGEAHNGALHREASGRLLEALDRSSGREAAREAARAYLTHYPRGPHASLAQRILGP